jgi:hypothetical protein
MMAACVLVVPAVVVGVRHAGVEEVTGSGGRSVEVQRREDGREKATLCNKKKKEKKKKKR